MPILVVIGPVVLGKGPSVSVWLIKVKSRLISVLFVSNEYIVFNYEWHESSPAFHSNFLWPESYRPAVGKRPDPSSVQIWIPFTQWCFVLSLVWNWTNGTLEKDFNKFRQCISAVSLLSPLGIGHDSIFEQTWIFFTQEYLVSLFGWKFAQWFWGRFLNFVNVILFFFVNMIYFLLERLFIWQTWRIFFILTYECFVQTLVKIDPVDMKINCLHCYDGQQVIKTPSIYICTCMYA